MSSSSKIAVRHIRPRPKRLAAQLWRVAASVLLGLLVPLLSSCSSGSGTTSGRIEVVAAENFYGDIAQQLGGPHVTVTSILTNPNADPHLFEPGTQNAAAVGAARLVIDNGLGYDAFMNRLLSAAPNSDRTVITIADELGVSGATTNPHLWYDLPRVPQIARAITDGLSTANPRHKDFFEARLRAFDRSLRPLDVAVAAIRSKHQGTPVAYTEPVPGYLLLAAGLNVLTPDAFAIAIEEGNEPSPQAVAAMEGLITGKRVRVLLYNSQATSQITDRLRTLAGQNGIPVVPVTETLPPEMTYQQWQVAQIHALGGALGG